MIFLYVYILGYIPFYIFVLNLMELSDNYVTPFIVRLWTGPDLDFESPLSLLVASLFWPIFITGMILKLLTWLTKDVLTFPAKRYMQYKGIKL